MSITEAQQRVDEARQRLDEAITALAEAAEIAASVAPALPEPQIDESSPAPLETVELVEFAAFVDDDL